jgi:hypothetical protein
MLTLVVERKSIQFPSRCLECGGPASDHFSLKVPRDRRPLAVSVCQRCSERKSLGQFLWVAASAVVGAGIVIGLAVAGDELIAIIPGLRAMAGLIVLACLAVGSIPVVVALSGGRRLYHRRFSAIWVEGRGPSSTEVILGFRTEELRRAVASLSGILVLGAAPFRENARTPDAFQKPEGQTSIPAWSVVLVGLVMIVAGVTRYWDIAKQESGALSISLYWPEWILYKMAGRAGVLSLFLVAGVATTLLGVALFRRVMRSRE